MEHLGIFSLVLVGLLTGEDREKEDIDLFSPPTGLSIDPGGGIRVGWGIYIRVCARAHTHTVILKLPSLYYTTVSKGYHP